RTQDDYRYPSAIPDPVSASACPHGMTLYGSLAELRCLSNAADYTGDVVAWSNWVPLDQMFYRRVSMVPVENEDYARYQTIAEVDCESFRTWIAELNSDRWRGFVRELEDRFRITPAWHTSTRSQPMSVIDAGLLDTRATECG